MYIILDSNVHVAETPPKDTTRLWVQATPLSVETLTIVNLDKTSQQLIYCDTNDFANRMAESSTIISSYALLEYELDTEVVHINYFDTDSEYWRTEESEANFLLANDLELATADGYIFNIKE